MDATAVIATIGGVALLIGIFGGGIRAKEVEIPRIPAIVRILSAITGIILLGIAIWLSIRSEAVVADKNPIATAVSAYPTNILSTQATPISEIPLSIIKTLPPTNMNPALATPTGEILFADDFEDGFSHGFSFYMGNWNVVDDGTGNKILEMRSDTSGSNASFGTYNFSDGVIEFRFKIVSAIHPIVTLSFRLNSASDWIDYKAVYDDGSLNLVYQDKNGWQPVEASSGGGSLRATPGDWITLRMEAQGEKLKLFANGNLMITATDSRLKTGQIYIGTSDKVIQFDDFKVWALKP